MEAEIKHIEDEQLANGVVVQFFDESRRVAGDRWQVRVRYDAVVTISESFWNGINGEADLISEIRADLGAKVVLTDMKERNFISEADKTDLIYEIVSAVKKNIFGYLADQEFPERYFKRCFKNSADKIELERMATAARDNEDIEELVDFSHLF